MAPAPIIDATELRAWSSVTAADGATAEAIDEVVAATNAAIASRVRDDTYDTDAASWPAAVHTAALVQGARWLKRRGSPEGVAGFGDLGIVRVGALDPDVEQLLSPWLRLVFA